MKTLQPIHWLTVIKKYNQVNILIPGLWSRKAYSLWFKKSEGLLDELAVCVFSTILKYSIYFCNSVAA